MLNLTNASPQSWLASQPSAHWHSWLATLSLEQKQHLLWKWRGWKARPNQLAPAGDWRVWFVLAGRGFGKTRTGAEYVREMIESGQRSRMALVAPTAADARDVMVEGESGIMAISPPWFRPVYEPSKRRITWPNGAIATTYSADEPDRLRGPQSDEAWCDEPASWRYPETWDMLQFGLRLGKNPRSVVTGTPKPVRLIRELLKAPTMHVTRGSTFDNAANLASGFLTAIKNKYEGTRLGRQELYAELLDDVPGAIWNRAQIDALRVRQAPALERIVVAIDPAVTSNEHSDETGIGVASIGENGHGYVIADLSGRYSAGEWAQIAVRAYHQHKADRIIAEVNNGGDLVESALRTVDRSISYKAVHASRGKATRAEPVAALYEQSKIHHCGSFPDLEDQLCMFTPGGYTGPGSPDRADWLVWAFTELMIDAEALPFGWLRSDADFRKKVLGS